MAEIETITVDLGKPMRITNIWNTRCANSIDHQKDVQAINALLYCHPSSFKKGKTFGDHS